MNGSAEKAKGQVEEAAGAIINDDELRAKGQMDQAMGSVKQTVNIGLRHAREDTRNIVDRAKDVVRQTFDKAKGGA